MSHGQDDPTGMGGMGMPDDAGAAAGDHGQHGRDRGHLAGAGAGEGAEPPENEHAAEPPEAGGETHGGHVAGAPGADDGANHM